jgi:heat shock protein HtpX
MAVPASLTLPVPLLYHGTTLSPERRPDFYEVQRRRWRISLVYTALMAVVYFLTFGLAAFFVLAAVDVAAGPAFSIGGPLAARVLLVASAAASLTAVAQYVSARRSGAEFILKRLCAAPPEAGDLYHARYLNTVEEIRIAAGLPRTRAYVLPFMAVNSLALVEADGTPAVVVTEGLLADGTREEVQASVSHELAHILRGDVFYITLLCSLADVFERLALALSPDVEKAPVFPSSGKAGAAIPLAAQGLGSLGASLSGAALRVLSLLISREREFLADAAAAELCRDPLSLARVLTKAGLKSAFVGDFSLVYAPLLMVSSNPSSESAGLKASLFHTHPPLAERIKILAAMAAKTPGEVAEIVWESRRMREDSRRLVVSRAEWEHERLHPETEEEAPHPSAEDDRPWRLQQPGRRWTQPLNEEEVVSHPMFSPLIMVRNDRDGVEARAREFPGLRRALRRLGRRQMTPDSRGGTESCPRCRKPLSEGYYEGVAVMACRGCGGRLVPMSGVERILARREFAFSEALLNQAREFRKTALRNPLVADRKAGRRPPNDTLCPRCGARMMSHPFNYQYFIPVDKCLNCRTIWFDADELEMLQVLVEEP